MKRLLLVVLIFLMGCAQVNRPGPFGKTGDDDSDTANPIDSLNPAGQTYGSSAYPGQLYNFAAQEDANRWSEQGFVNLVSVLANANACLGTTGAGLVMTPVSCVAYNAGYRSTETGSITFPNGSTCWVAMDENTSGNNAGLPNFTRVTSTHYLIDCIDVSEPSTPTDAQILMKVVTSGGAITGVTDERTTSIAVSGITGSIETGSAPSVAQYITAGRAEVGPATISKDATLALGGALTVTKTNGVAFATSATTDTTNASNITTGTLSNSQLPSTITVAHVVGSTDVTDTGGTSGRCVQFGSGGILTSAGAACATTAGIAQGGPLTQALAAGGYRITGAGTDITTGDVLSNGQSTLNSLAPAVNNYSMGTNTLTNLAAPAATGEPEVEGSAIGGTTPANGTFTNLQATVSVQGSAQTLAESSGTLTPTHPALNGGPDVLITIADNSNFTIANPTGFAFVSNLIALHWWIRIVNNVGGSAGTITLGANYRTDTSWGAPGSGKTRICPVLTTYNGSGTISYIGPCTADETN